MKPITVISLVFIRLLFLAACHSKHSSAISPNAAPTQADSVKILQQFADHILVGATEDRDILKIAPLDEDHYYGVVSISTSTCSYTYLILLNNQFDIQKGLCIEDQPDSDESFARYKYTDYEMVQDSIFLIHDINTHVVDTSLVEANGFIKGGKTIDDVENKTDTTTRKITLSLLLTDKIENWSSLWR